VEQIIKVMALEKVGLLKNEGSRVKGQLK